MPGALGPMFKILLQQALSIVTTLVLELIAQGASVSESDLELGAFSSSADGLGVGDANQDPPSQGAWFLRLNQIQGLLLLF